MGVEEPGWSTCAVDVGMFGPYGCLPGMCLRGRCTKSAPLRYGKSSDSWMTIGAVSNSGIALLVLADHLAHAIPPARQSGARAERRLDGHERRLSLDHRLRGEGAIVVARARSGANRD